MVILSVSAGELAGKRGDIIGTKVCLISLKSGLRLTSVCDTPLCMQVSVFCMHTAANTNWAITNVLRINTESVMTVTSRNLTFEWQHFRGVCQINVP
jgi:hypothetical protein